MTTAPLPAVLSEKELAELDRFLSSDATSDQAMMVDTLDGYLTAIALGPVTLPADRWLPRIWGPKDGDLPDFASADQAARITGLIQRHLNGIIDRLHADDFEPILDTVAYQDKEREYLDGEMWSFGFLTGLGLARREWQPLFENGKAMEALLPIYLLGAEDISAEQRKQVQTPAQREALAKQIAAGVAVLYQFWLPYREAMHERIVATTVQRDAPKVGRNDPCPCGSGKKFKKCCGAAAELH
ncbi:MAG: YecA family protein [Rhodocyclaceae bacterium]|nr:MAG: YecA family protein [Rhodocyclaceae bacterium]